MDKKSLKVKIFLNFFGTYKEVRQVADITTTSFDNIINKNDVPPKQKRKKD